MDIRGWTLPHYPRLLTIAGDGDDDAGGAGGDDGTGANGKDDVQVDADQAKRDGLLKSTKIGKGDDDDAGDGDGDGSGDNDGDGAGKGADDKEQDKNTEGKAYAPEGLASHLVGESDKETIDKLNAAYKGARKELSDKAGLGKVPDKAEGYAVELPDGVELKAITDKDSLAEDDTFKAAAEVAIAAGVPDKLFDKFIGGLFAKFGEMGILGSVFDTDAELEQLGGKDKANGVIAGIKLWGQALLQQGILSKEEAAEFEVMGGTALGIRVFNKLRALTGEKPIPLDTAGVEGEMTQADWYKAAGSDKYQTDEAYRNKIDKIGKKLFPGGMVGTSPMVGVGKAPSAFRKET